MVLSCTTMALSQNTLNITEYWILNTEYTEYFIYVSSLWWSPNYRLSLNTIPLAAPHFSPVRPALLSWHPFCLFAQQNKIILDPLTFSEARFRPSLEERLESIISGAALMADSSCTRDDRRERIVAECNAVRQALQDLLSEYMNNVSFFSDNLICFS